MAEDLGTWPPEQARVLIEALQKAGLSPKAKRTREGVLVTVEDTEADEAHRTLVANMDAIAQAARGPQTARKRNRPRPTSQAKGGAQERPLASQRFGALSRPLIILMIGLILAVLIVPLRIPILVFTIAAVIYLLGKQPRNEDEP